MNVLGLTITRTKAAPVQVSTPGSGGWLSLIRESFGGAWQRNIEIRTDAVLTNTAVFRCIALISGDIAKMRMRLVQQSKDGGVWREVTNPAHSPVLRKPNGHQNRIQFFGAWMESKLIHGNTYVLKERDARNVVTGLYVMHPELVTVLITPDGGVYYELQTDHLAGIVDRIVVPAREVIHDRWNTLTHPLVGMSPIHACGLAATQGLRIQEGSTRFFANGSTPGGVLTAPGFINKETAERLEAHWNQKYGPGGSHAGLVAVLGDGLKYEAMTITAADAQLLEQLKLTAETVCTAFGVPPFKIGVGNPPTYNNIEALDTQYYSQCLQIHIESIELGLDEGLELKGGLGTEFDLDNLLRMDAATQVKTMGEAVNRGILAPDEARAKLGYRPVEGGATPYLQVQNYSLAALAKRDANSSPVTPGLDQPAPTDAAETDDEEPEDDGGDEARAFLAADILRRSQPHYVPATP